MSREGELLRRQGLRDFATMLQDLLIEYVGLTGGEVPETNRGTRMLSLAMVGGIQEALVEWLHEEERQPIDELAEVLAEIVGHELVVDVALEVDEEAVVAEPLLGGAGLELGEVDGRGPRTPGGSRAGEPGVSVRWNTTIEVLS